MADNPTPEEVGDAQLRARRIRASRQSDDLDAAVERLHYWIAKVIAQYRRGERWADDEVQHALAVESVLVALDQRTRAIESFGSNPAGFDWAVLQKVDDLEAENDQLKAQMLAIRTALGDEPIDLQEGQRGWTPEYHAIMESLADNAKLRRALEDLGMMVRRLVRHVPAMQVDAIGLLRRHNLQGSILRADVERIAEGGCDHPWHRNPGLITPCPECGAGIAEGGETA